ncbi:MAG: hypothetical protein M3Y13_01955, partial [Armatimonadota bacterium]|nr:hypothetical protein [Armatimonadota bacterium]
AAAASGLTEQQINDLAQGFQRAGTRAVALGGNGLLASVNAPAAFTAIESLNAQVKSQCVGFGESLLTPSSGGIGKAPALSGSPRTGGVGGLIPQMQAGQIGALLVLGQSNPVFTLPTASGFTEALAKVPFVAALTPFEDETTAYADVVLPTRSFLEDWSDDIPAVLPPNTRMATLRQPIIDPQFVGGNGQATDHLAPFTPWMDTRPLGDLLIDLAKRLGKPLPDADMRAVVRRTWAGLGQANLAAATTDNDPKWVDALAQGGLWKTKAAAAPSVGRVPTGQNYAGPANAPAPGAFALHLYPHIYWTDGRHSNLGWLQETPDPMTSAVWNSWVEINSDVAHQMDIRTGDIVRISTAHGQIEVPAVPYPGIHPNVIAMPIGQGHAVYGRNAAARGANPLAILDPAEGALGAASVQLTKVRQAEPGYEPEQNTLVLTQDRPGGQEPEAVKDLIHTTAREWKTAKPVSGAPQAAESIFNRQDSNIKPGSQ